MNRPRIGFFAPHFADGGLEKTNIKLAAEFELLGFEVFLITFQYDPCLLESIPNKIRVVDLGVSRSIFSILPLIGLLRSNEYEIVIACQHYANIIAVAARLFTGKVSKLILCERISISSALRMETGLKSWFMPAMIRWAYKRADAVIANSSDNAEELKAFIGEKGNKPNISYVYNPTLTPDIYELAKESCPEFEGLEHKFKVVIAGRLSSQKDHKLLLDALAEAVQDAPQILLVIVGDGPLKPELERYCDQLGITDHVIFFGFQENPYRFMARCDVLVLTSKYEGLPNVLIEAQALGIPLISTDCPTGPREIMLDGALGWLFPVGDLAQLSRLLVASIREYKELQEKASKALMHIERFDPKRNAMKYIKSVGSTNEG